MASPTFENIAAKQLDAAFLWNEILTNQKDVNNHIPEQTKYALALPRTVHHRLILNNDPLFNAANPKYTEYWSKAEDYIRSILNTQNHLNLFANKAVKLENIPRKESALAELFEGISAKRIGRSLGQSVGQCIITLSQLTAETLSHAEQNMHHYESRIMLYGMAQLAIDEAVKYTNPNK